MSVFRLGEEIPNFTLSSASGEDYSFENYRMNYKDYWHILIYFRGSWCSSCLEELKELEAEKHQFEEQQVKITAISADHLDALKQMATDHDLSFPVLADQERTVLEQYGIYYHDEESPYEDHGTHGEPAYFLTDGNGRLLYQQRQTSPFGRPQPKELRQIVQYIDRNSKQTSGP